MSERDERVEAAARALWRANRQDGKPQTYPYDRLIESTREDLLGLARAALAAADAVQGGEVDRLANDLAGDWRERAERAERDVAMWKQRIVEQGEQLREELRRARSQPADDRRMVELDATIEDLIVSVDNLRGYRCTGQESFLGHVDSIYRKLCGLAEFCGPAPSEDQP